MNGANGHAYSQATSTPERSAVSDFPSPSAASVLSPEQVARLFAELEVPFDQGLVEWRVTNTADEKQRGQIVPYASPRAYTDRLNALVSPAGWTRRYAVHTSANFERAKDKKIIAKVLVTCELTIFGLGTHSATGEEFADGENALTAAEAQSFKRAASCFGLGRYLYHFKGVWVDLDERKRPKNIPRLFGWATPEGWRQGLRPGQERGGQSVDSAPINEAALANVDRRDATRGETDLIVGEIEAMAKGVGRRLYRGILKNAARVWSAAEIHDPRVLKEVLGQMQTAVEEVQRLRESLSRVEPGTLTSVLRSLRLTSLDHVDSLEILQRVVLQVERAAETSQQG